MVQHHHVEGYDNFLKFIKTLKSDGSVVCIYFSGSKDKDTGESWCDDCRRAWPVISKVLDEADPSLYFVYVEVGDRPFWKDPNCPFRQDHNTKLLVLPTLVRWKSPKRLTGSQCEKEELVKMLICDDDED